MTSPITTTPSREARRTAIDNEAAASVAASPTFVSSLHLPPIPPSTPPLERREIEARRTELTKQLASAAAQGNETEFRRVMGLLVPGASELASASAYGSARLAFLEKRTNLLITECANSTAGPDRAATAYWLAQLGHTIQERFNMDPQGMQTSTSMYDSALRAVASRIPGKSGQPEYNRRMETLLDSAIDAGYPAREAFAIAREKGLENQPSSIDSNETVSHRLLTRAITRSRELFADCARLHGQDSPAAQVEFSRKYNEFRRLCSGLLPNDFDQGIFERPAEHSAFLNDVQLHLRISANSVFVP